jgi:hypothetical protein
LLQVATVDLWIDLLKLVLAAKGATGSSVIRKPMPGVVITRHQLP